jgi:predicted nucleic acid-binding protein
VLTIADEYSVFHAILQQTVISPRVGKTARLVSRFPLLEETPAIFPAWKALVSALGVIGKQVHDARLVAVCHVHGVANILTFNTGHFTRLAAFGPGLAVLDPAAV